MTKTCEFCGQEVLVPHENTEGWEVCTCDAARIRQRYQDLVLEGDELIDEIFDAPEADCGFQPVSGSALETLRYLLREIAQGVIGSVRVGLGDGSQAQIHINAHGQIEIARSKRRKIANTTK